MLRLVPEGPISSDLRHSIGHDFLPIRWEKRCYLIPEKEQLVFCSLVNQGVFPHYMRRGPFSMGDSERPKGVPEVPPEWAPFLLQKPVNGTITKILSDSNAIMNLGARDGVRSGMEFLRKKWHPWTVKVLFTETDRCIIRIKTGKPGTIPDATFEPGHMYPGLRPLEVGEIISSRSSDQKSNR